MRVSHSLLKAWSIVVVFSVILLLGAVVPVVNANTQQQTVPTMPPPTKSPTVTSPSTPVNPPENTPTNSVQPSATSVMETYLPSTQTQMAATQTEFSVLKSSTVTIEPLTGTPSPAEETASLQIAVTMTVNPSISSHMSPEQENSKPGVLSVIGAGLGIVFLIALIIWFWRLEARSK